MSDVKHYVVATKGGEGAIGKDTEVTIERHPVVRARAEAGINKGRRPAPSHYAFGIEPMDYISGAGLCFRSGNVVKYVSRAGRKRGESRLQALLKARDNLQDLIDDEMGEGQ